MLHFFHRAFLAVFFTLLLSPLTAQATWERLDDHPLRGLERVFSFELDGLLYIGTGRISTGNNTAVVYCYDPATDNWTRKSSFPGGARRNAFGFQLAGKGYVGAGLTNSGHTDDFWRYNPFDDSWTQLADFPGGAISHCLAVSDDSTAYVIGGGRSVPPAYERAVYAFDAATETWSDLPPIPGAGRWRAFGWIIGDKLYVGGGDQFPNLPFRDFYSFDLATQTWDNSDLAGCPTNQCTGGFYFTLQNKGYYLEGDDNNSTPGTRLFSYDPLTGRWTQDLSLPATGRVLGFSAVVDNRAIIGGGRVYQTELYYNDVYAFSPETATATIVTPAALGITVFPNPVGEAELTVRGDFTPGKDVVFRILDMKGALQRSANGNTAVLTDSNLQLDVAHLLPGIYQLELIHDDKRVAVRFVKQ